MSDVAASQCMCGGGVFFGQKDQLWYDESVRVCVRVLRAIGIGPLYWRFDARGYGSSVG